MKILFSLHLVLFSSVVLSQVPNWSKETCSHEPGAQTVSYEMYNELEAGNAVLIEFSTMWCPPCNAVAPELETMWQNLQDEQFQFFSFLFENENYNITDCDDDYTWITTHGLTYPGFVDCNDILNDYYTAFGDGSGGIGIPWFLLFFPDMDNPSSSELMYEGGSLSEINQILTNQWLPQVASTSLNSKKRQLIQLLDMMGRETTFKPNTPLIYIYDDGSTEKLFTIE